MCICLHVCADACACVYGGQRSPLSVFLNHSSSHLLGWGLLLTLEFDWLVQLSSKLQAFSCSCLRRVEIVSTFWHA